MARVRDGKMAVTTTASAMMVLQENIHAQQGSIVASLHVFHMFYSLDFVHQDLLIQAHLCKNIVSCIEHNKCLQKDHLGNKIIMLLRPLFVPV